MTTPTPQPRPASSSAPRPAAAPAPKPSKLAGLVAGQIMNARSFFIYGIRGIGKSTFGADAPNPIFIDTTHSTEHLHVARYPDPDGGWTWASFLDAFDDLTDNPHGFQTLVVEDVGHIETLIWREVVAEDPPDRKTGYRAKNIEEVGGGFHKGYAVALGRWRDLTARIDRLRTKRRMHVILLGHSAIRNAKNPAGEDYDAHMPQIHRDAAGVLCADLDVVGFASFTDSTVLKSGGRKSRGATGDRVIRLKYDAIWPMAKSRLPMDEEVPIEIEHPFRPFLAAMAQASMTTAMLRQKIEAELERLGAVFVRDNGAEATAAGVRAAVEKAGDNFDSLSRFLNVLRQAQPKTDNDKETP